MKSLNFRENNFDLIRLLAAFQVAFIHSYQHFGFKFESFFVLILGLFPGVPIFFVISGFLISSSLDRSSSLSSYLKNRFLRIYPGLWACFLISTLSVVIIYHPDLKTLDFLKWVVAQLTICQFYNPSFFRGYGVGVLNGSLWTIPVELQFYMLLPAFYLACNKLKNNTIFLLLMILVFIIINQLYNFTIPTKVNIITKLFGVTVFPYLYMFLIGVFLQKNFAIVSNFLKNRVLIILALYLLIALASRFLKLNCTGNYLNPLSAIVLGCLVISFGYSYTNIFNNILKGNDLSYGMYIYHMVIINIVISLSTMPPIVNVIITIITTLFIALLSWRFIEKPCLQLKSYSIKTSAIANTKFNNSGFNNNAF